MSYFYKILLIFLGTLFLGLGILGIFIPGLPTTPFLLLTAALYLRSSDRLYKKLISNKIIGKYIKNYVQKRGMTIRIKVHAIGIMWLMISISTIFLIEIIWVKILVLTLGIIGTIVMGFVVKTVR